MADGLLNKASIILTPTGYKAGTLYNVAPVVEPYEDFDFARASVASRVNSSGLVEMVGRTLSSELVTNGDFATDSDWTKGAGWSIADGVANNDGTINAIYQPKAIQSGKIYKCTIDITFHSAGVAYWRLGNTTNIGVMSTNQTSFTQYLVGSANGNYVGIFTNTSITIDNVSVKEVIDTNNIPRISYDSNGDNGHILLEPTSTNLITYSEDFSQWTKTGSTNINATNILSPSGENNGTNITGLSGSGGNDLKFFVSSFNSANKTLTVSVYLKGSGTLRVQMSNGVDQGFDDTITLSSNWTRYTLTATFNSTNSGNLFHVNIDDSGATATSYDVWGAQLEELSYPTSYIPTLTGSTVTRATETATGAGSATLINSTEGVLYAEIAALSTTEGSGNISLSDGTGDNRIYIYYFVDNAISVIHNINSSGAVINNFTLSDITSYTKIATRWGNSNFSVWINGTEVLDVSASNFTSNTLNLLNLAKPSGTGQLEGKVKALAVFNEALSDSELTQLTT